MQTHECMHVKKQTPTKVGILIQNRVLKMLTNKQTNKQVLYDKSLEIVSLIYTIIYSAELEQFTFFHLYTLILNHNY